MQTEIKYNKAREDFLSQSDELIDEIEDYNNYIKIIETNLNKIIFSRKVVLVEGPNDMMVYKEAIYNKILDKTGDAKFADTYLNFNNISIIPHHGKVTALVLIKLCKHLGLDYFVINDFDFEVDFIDKLVTFHTEYKYKQSEFYLDEIKMIEARNIKGEELSESTKKE